MRNLKRRLLAIGAVSAFLVAACASADTEEVSPWEAEFARVEARGNDFVQRVLADRHVSRAEMLEAIDRTNDCFDRYGVGFNGEYGTRLTESYLSIILSPEEQSIREAEIAANPDQDLIITTVPGLDDLVWRCEREYDGVIWLYNLTRTDPDLQDVDMLQAIFECLQQHEVVPSSMTRLEWDAWMSEYSDYATGLSDIPPSAAQMQAREHPGYDACWDDPFH